MALKQRRTPKIRFVSETDSAIDLEKSDWIKYFENGCDMSFLSFVENEKPTIFELGRLSYRQRQNAKGMDDASVERAEYIVRCSLKHVENMPIEDENDEIVDWINEVELERTQDGFLVTKAWLRNADFPMVLIDQLASAAWILSEGGFPLFKRSGVRSGATGSKSQSKQKSQAK